MSTAQNTIMSQRHEKTTWGSERTIFLALVVFRIVNALSIKTFFQPDEYFQSLEPAWELAFGKSSGAWITWEWREQLRSSLHPLLFASVYRLADSISSTLALSTRSRASLLLTAPKVTQAIIAAVGDAYSWQLARRFYGPDSTASWISLALTTCSPWQWFCSVRTFSNSLEMTLTAVALAYWPWEWYGSKVPTVAAAASWSGSESSLRASLIVAAIACILRPTNAIIWAVAVPALLVNEKNRRHLFNLAKEAAICGGFVLSVSLASDWNYYGRAAFPPVRFLYFNIIQSLAVFYGRNRTDYYLTEGLPLILTTALPFAVIGLVKTIRGGMAATTLPRAALLSLAIAVVVKIALLSAIGHKEVRFLYPLLPILHLLACQPVAGFLRSKSRSRVGLVVVLLGINVVVAAYVGSVHQRGVIDVLSFLRQRQEMEVVGRSAPSIKNMTVGFLMPCHSTPWRSHLIHSQISGWALTCEPPLDVPLDRRSEYLDEADVFYDQPEAWIKKNLLKGNESADRTSRPLPQYLVFFEQLQDQLEKATDGCGYTECWRGFNTHWHDDWRRQGDVIVWRLP